MTGPLSPLPVEFSDHLREQLRRLLLHFDEMRMLVPPTPGAWAPAVDLFEMEDTIIVRLELPGVAASDFRVTLLDGVLKIEGRKERVQTAAEESAERPLRYLCLERASGNFMRRVPLKWVVDTEGISTHLNDGILEIRLPKAHEAGREIEIPINEGSGQ